MLSLYLCCIRSLLGVQGVSFAWVVDSYYALVNHWAGRKSDRILQLLWSVSWVLEEWTKRAAAVANMDSR